MQELMVTSYSFLLPFNMRKPVSGQAFADTISKTYDNAHAQEVSAWVRKHVKDIKRTFRGIVVNVYTPEHLKAQADDWKGCARD